MVSFPSSLVDFLGFNPYMCLFSFRKLLVTCSCCFFFVVVRFFLGVLYCCVGMVKEKRGRRGGQGEDTCIKFDNVHIQLRIIIKLPVNPNITLFFIYTGV